MDASNTGENRKQKPGTFEKGAGKDPRINRKGRPKSFDALRSLTQQIAHEVARKSKEQGGEPVIVDGHAVTITEAIMRSWAVSKDPRLQQKFIEVAYGQVPSVTRLEGQDGGPMVIKVVYENEDNADPGA